MPGWPRTTARAIYCSPASGSTGSGDVSGGSPTGNSTSRLGTLRYRATPPPSHIRSKPSTNSGNALAKVGERVAALRAFVEQDPLHVAFRRVDGVGPDVVRALVHEVVEPEALPREFLHVVRERAHAGENLVARPDEVALAGTPVTARRARLAGRSHCASSTMGALASSGDGPSDRQRHENGDLRRPVPERPPRQTRTRPTPRAPAPPCSARGTGGRGRTRRTAGRRWRRAPARPARAHECGRARTTRAPSPTRRRRRGPWAARRSPRARARLRRAPPNGRPCASFSGTKKPPVTNQLPVLTRLLTMNSRMATTGQTAIRPTSRAARRQCTPRRSSTAQRQRQQRGRDGPRLVASHAGQRETVSPGSQALVRGVAASPRRRRQRRADEQREQQRLGHRRRLQVQHVGVGGEHRGGGQRRQPTTP